MDPSSSAAAVQESRPQAGPLPRKRGEIGFSEDMHQEAEASRSGSPTAPMPDRHPEDRGATTPAPADSASREGSSDSEVAPSTAPSINSLATTSTDSISKKKRILHFLKPKKVPSYGGLRLTTLLAFASQVCMFCATIVGWYFAISRTSHMSSSSSDSQGGDNSQQGNVLGNSSTQIFIHVVFGVACLVQLLFLERRVFRLRAERYTFVHPGEILPSARRRQMGDPSMGFSPWNRPPLPTYAAALAQSGAGTGDVEDHLIAAAPPPAYGQTRGSTMLLSGFLRDSLRAQRPVSAQTQATERPMSQRSDRGRPISYRSVDEDWEEVQNAERARRLEETLSTLERPTPAHTAP